MFLWVRATFPRYRYDQIMRLGWKIFIPITLVWLVVVGLDAVALQHLEVRRDPCLQSHPSRFLLQLPAAGAVKGMALTGRHFLSPRSPSSSRKKDAAVAALPWPARPAPL
jgi:hypothetical protein